MGISHNKLWRYYTLRNAYDKMEINDTHYIVRSGDDVLLRPFKRVDNDGKTAEASMLQRLTNAGAEARHYPTWAEAEADAEKLNEEMVAAFGKIDAWAIPHVERVDAKIAVDEVVDRWELWLDKAENREDGIDRIRSHLFSAEEVPGYVRELKPLFVRYFKLREELDDLWKAMSEEDKDAYCDFIAELRAAKRKVREIEKNMKKKADQTTSMSQLLGGDD